MYDGAMSWWSAVWRPWRPRAPAAARACTSISTECLRGDGSCFAYSLEGESEWIRAEVWCVKDGTRSGWAAPLPVEATEEGVRFEKRQVGAPGAETVLRVADEELGEQHPARGGDISGEVEVRVVGVEAQNLPRREVEVRRR